MICTSIPKTTIVIMSGTVTHVIPVQLFCDFPRVTSRTSQDDCTRFFIRKYFIRKQYPIHQKVKKVQYWIW